ncbi:MAG: tetratricopeptide repeat protein [Muribaculaceae bacterium]|nr:tetratricopeptide repeat protein [Muribaculaceae bacterium]
MKLQLLLLALGACISTHGQLVAPGNAGSVARAESFFLQEVPQGTLDCLLFSTDVPALLSARALLMEGNYDAARAAFEAYATAHPAAEDYPAALTGAADCLFAKGDYAAAEEAYSLVPTGALSPSDAGKLIFRRGICAFCAADAKRAGNFFADAAKYPDSRAAAQYYLGVIAFDARDWDAAERHFALTDTGGDLGRRATYYQAQIDFVRSQWTKALAAARRVLRSATADERPEMLRIAGESLYRLGQNGEALDYLRNYIASTPNPAPSALYVVGSDAYRRGDYIEAVSLLGRAVETGTDATMLQSAYLYIGEALMHQGDYDAAIIAFDKAIRAGGSDSSVEEAAYYNYAVARFKGATVPFSSAADTFDDFLKRYPTGTYSERVAEYLADGYLSEHDYERALERSRRIANPSPALLAVRQKALYGLGWTALEQGRYDDAATHLAEAAAINGEHGMSAEIALLQGIVESRRDNHGGAAVFFERYVSRAPHSSPNAALGNYRLGYAYFRSGRTDAAERAFRAALPSMKDAARADVLSRLGDIRSHAGDYSAAEALYRQAGEAWAPTADYPSLELARIAGYRRDYEKKLRLLADFKQHYSSSALMPDALLETTQAQISLGRNNDAIATYNTLIADYPNTIQGRQAYLQLAMTLLDQKRLDEAAKTYRSLISRFPTSEEAASAAALLRTLYAGEGRADDYMEFMSSVDNAPAIDAADTEALALESAVNALNRNGDSSQLKRFAATYPTSARRAEVLGLLLLNADKHGNKAEAEKYAAELIERYPDSRYVEEAMAVEARRLHDENDIEEALTMWRKLDARTTDPAMAARARIGAMRAARETGDYATAAAMADELLQGDAPDSNDFSMTEALYTKADALDATGKSAEAIELWLKAADKPGEEFGARSAYRAADALFDAGDKDKALETARTFARSGSQHHYWIARTFILMSDIYRAEGKEFEAREYLLALRDNYTGDDTDIAVMIDERLEDSDK